MARYVIRRAAYGLVTIWLVTIIVFTMLRVLVPLFYGDVVDIMVGELARNDTNLQQELRAQYGLSDSVPIQYVKWVGNLVRGDLGESLYTGRSITQEMGRRLPVSLELGLIGLASAALLAIPMGAAAALMQDKWPDYVLRIYAIGSNSCPGSGSPS